MVATLAGGVSNDSGFTVLACSPSADRVVVAHTVCCAVDSTTVLQLSTGRVLYHLEHHAPNSALYVTGSIDGRYITAAVWPEARQASQSATCQVRDSSSGRTVSAVFTGRCDGFSADGRRLLLSSDRTAGTARFRLLNWATGQIIWTSDSDTVWILPRPQHRSLYVAGWRYAATGSAAGTYGDISILRDDGTPVPVTSNAFFSAP